MLLRLIIFKKNAQEQDKVEYQGDDMGEEVRPLSEKLRSKLLR